MKVPVVLPVAQVRIDDAGILTVMLDGQPYAGGVQLQRRDLQQLLTDITSEVKVPVRVEVSEADGTTYCDIATPTDPSSGPPACEIAEQSAAAGVRGAGFQPGERVAIAYVLAHETADADGAAVVRLPVAVLARRQGAMLLFGCESRVATLIEDPA